MIIQWQYLLRSGWSSGSSSLIDMSSGSSSLIEMSKFGDVIFTGLKWSNWKRKRKMKNTSCLLYYYYHYILRFIWFCILQGPNLSYFPSKVDLYIPIAWHHETEISPCTHDISGMFVRSLKSGAVQCWTDAVQCWTRLSVVLNYHDIGIVSQM